MRQPLPSNLSSLSAPQIVVRSLAEACTALDAAAACGCCVVLVSAPGVAGHVGAGWFIALVDAARRAVPGVCCAAIVDCANAAGHAMAALRTGAPAIAIADIGDAARARLDALARRHGARLAEIDHAGALDLASQANGAAACRAFLSRRKDTKTGGSIAKPPAVR